MDDDYITLSGTSVDTITITADDAYVLDTTTMISTVGSSDTISISSYSMNEEWMTVTRGEHKELIDRVEKLERMLAEEARLREEYPTVKNAYEEYRLLLSLVKEHCPKSLTE